MKLTDRLQMIADGIRAGETMADIGTDHGFLPIFLAESGICPHVIMTDISDGSLTKAETDLRLAQGEGNAELEGRTELRLGDGLSVLKPGEVDVVVIAGMGGILMTEILGADPEKTGSFGRFILQPRNNPGRLRAFLLDRGFRITREQIVREHRFLCEIITAVPPGDVTEPGTRGKAYGLDPVLTAELDYPDALLSVEESLGTEYLRLRREKHEQVLAAIRENARMCADRQAELEETRIRRIRELEERLVKES